jgi:23S rRNA pseudouridine1911/1915/1917 synthase
MKYELNDQVRIDIYLKDKTEYTRSKLEAYFKSGDILVNNKPVKKSYLLKYGDVITLPQIETKPLNIDSVNLNLDIIYEDEDVLVVNKQNGLVVHPAPGNPTNTLVNGLLYHSKTLSSINGDFRPGIVHRIDAYTTGLLMVAKNDQAHLSLAKQLENKTITRKYIALVWGVIKEDTAVIDAPIGRDKQDRKKMCVTDINAKKAVTHIKVLQRFKNATLIEVTLETGRTHQIRVHMNYINHPVVNDPVYGKRKIIDNSGQCLHAKELGFIHPKTGEYMFFTSELPECFTNILNEFINEEL